MNYRETLDYLYSQLPMYSRIGAAAYKADLTNTIRLCNELGNPHHQFKSVHIAGTNGKGSVSHMLAAILQSAGYKTGLYTSPHLRDFRERIKIDGTMISEGFVVGFTEKIKHLITGIQPSFFEITVAMAFDYFAEQKIDIAIVETGLGGRLDSTNIISPELSVITNIGWDHINLLGDSLEKIAGEKAGIIKERIPVVIGEVIPETRPVFEKKALEQNAPISIASEQRHVMDWYWEKTELIVEVAQEHHTDHRKYHLDLPGLYQAKNLLTVLEACSVLQRKGWNIDEKAILAGLQQTKKITGLHGRWETIHHSPQVVLDVAHNVDGIRQLARQIEHTPHRELHIIIGMVNDKDIDRVLALLPKNALYYFTRAQIPRALPEGELLERASAFKLKGDAFPDVNEALEFALQHAHPDDLVIICGSVFLVGEVDISQLNRSS
ncbi:MAG TPA: folylpolyglutamate synthase/dihydrofolate synthase family protein [Chitinophagaceae bacterium]|jgi:dihydrofolate synthase/folylpolyglutamate synthase|nr:folylpolyglutamate synthase/dihydrofolate synthase family protein [Chitinophagaceae bacterium]